MQGDRPVFGNPPQLKCLARLYFEIDIVADWQIGKPSQPIYDLSSLPNGKMWTPLRQVANRFAIAGWNG